MSSYTLGRQGERTAAEYLGAQGFRIIGRNWKTRFCEIDIVALREGCIYFVEVKLRSKPTWGRAIAYITPKKLNQMRFAAASWVHIHAWRGDYRLVVVSIDGRDISFTLL